MCVFQRSYFYEWKKVKSLGQWHGFRVENGNYCGKVCNCGKESFPPDDFECVTMS